MVASTFHAFKSTGITPISDYKGTVFPSPNDWIASPLASLWTNIGLIAAIAVMMVYINKAYNLPRTITLICATMFAVIETATPGITAQLCSGTVMAAIIVGSMILMFGVYSQPGALRRVFMVFFLLSSAVTVQYAFAVYIPVFLVACAQMRIFTLRSMLAALLGIITPWWIIFGGGIASPADLHLPHFTSLLDNINSTDTVILLITIGITVLLLAGAYVLSLLKLMTYNARTRACNGLLTLVSLVTIVAMGADLTNFITYLTLLNCCTAFFLGHLFVIRNHQRSWIAIAAIIALYYAIYIWRIIV